MSNFLIRSATSQSSSYPIVLTRLGGPRSRPNPHLKFVEVPGIEPATSWLYVGAYTLKFQYLTFSPANKPNAHFLAQAYLHLRTLMYCANYKYSQPYIIPRASYVQAGLKSVPRTSHLEDNYMLGIFSASFHTCLSAAALDHGLPGLILNMSD